MKPGKFFLSKANLNDGCLTKKRDLFHKTATKRSSFKSVTTCRTFELEDKEGIDMEKDELLDSGSEK